MTGVQELPSGISVGVFEDTGQFVSYAFAADEADAGCGLDDRTERIGVDFEFVSGGKSHGAKHPLGVVEDVLGWV